MNIGMLLTRNSRYRPNHLAVVFEDQRLTFRTFNQRVNRLANAFLALGIRKGDKIATLLPNSLELLETYWAGAKIGAVVVPLNTLTRGKGLITMLGDSDSVCVLTDSSFMEHLSPVRGDIPIAPDRYLLTDASSIPGYQDYHALTAAAGESDPECIDIADDDPYNIMYTSGTTGEPKGIVHSHYVRAMYGSVLSSAFRITPESIIIHAGALVFNGAFITFMPAFFLGATYILERQFSPERLIDTIKREQATHIMLVPSQITALLNASNFSPESLRSLEMVGSVGAPLHKEYKDQLNRHLPGRLYELYGLTEGFLTILDKNDFATKSASVGVPPPFVEMRIVDEQGKNVAVGQVGEIVGRGPFLMSEYYKRPDLTADVMGDGWLRTGDMGYEDADGFLYLVDRKKDMIISGGVNVYPKDIEEIAVQHPEVLEVAVFGIPHEKWGETPVAAVTLKRSATVTAEKLRDWINERIEARFQRVYSVVIMEDFPRSTAGKTLKRVLREPYWAGLESRI